MKRNRLQPNWPSPSGGRHPDPGKNAPTWLVPYFYKVRGRSADDAVHNAAFQHFGPRRDEHIRMDMEERIRSVRPDAVPAGDFDSSQIEAPPSTEATAPLGGKDHRLFKTVAWLYVIAAFVVPFAMLATKTDSTTGQRMPLPLAAIIAAGLGAAAVIAGFLAYLAVVFIVLLPVFAVWDRVHGPPGKWLHWKAYDGPEWVVAIHDRVIADYSWQAVEWADKMMSDSTSRYKNPGIIGFGRPVNIGYGVRSAPSGRLLIDSEPTIVQGDLLLSTKQGIVGTEKKGSTP